MMPDLTFDPSCQLTVEPTDADMSSLRALAILLMTVFRGWPYL